MKMSNFFAFAGVLFAISVVMYLTTTPRGREIPLTGIVTGNDLIVSSQIAGRVIRLAVDKGWEVHNGNLIVEVGPVTYAVHALKALLLKNTGFSGIYSDILILSGFSVVLVSLSVAFFKRQI
jgi:ABC-type multidrug transport system permease subunit